LAPVNSSVENCAGSAENRPATATFVFAMLGAPPANASSAINRMTSQQKNPPE
jgi:hypothetical protein